MQQGRARLRRAARAAGQRNSSGSAARRGGSRGGPGGGPPGPRAQPPQERGGRASGRVPHQGCSHVGSDVRRAHHELAVLHSDVLKRVCAPQGRAGASGWGRQRRGGCGRGPRGTQLTRAPVCHAAAARTALGPAAAGAPPHSLQPPCTAANQPLTTIIVGLDARSVASQKEYRRRPSRVSLQRGAVRGPPVLAAWRGGAMASCRGCGHRRCKLPQPAEQWPQQQA